MTLITGSAVGTGVTQESITLEGAPYLYFQDYGATPLHNPDADSYYWGLSATSAYPWYLLGCVNDVSLTEDVTLNQIRCDTVGDKDAVQKRNFLEFKFTLLSLFPLTSLAPIMNASTPTVSGSVEKMGVGKINNNKYYMVYAPKVYDDATGDYLLIHMHKAKFVNAWSIAMPSGSPWQMTGVTIRAFFDDTKTAGQEFATIIRADASAI